MPAIRFATIDDLPDIRALWKALGAEQTRPYPRQFWERPGIDTFTRQVALALTSPEGTGYVLLAEDDTRPVGFLLFEFHQREIGTPSHYVFVHWVYVDPAHRSSGVGTNLIQMAAEFALSHGLHDAEITYTPGTRLWDFLGFDPFEVRAHCSLTQVVVRCEERRKRWPPAESQAAEAIGNGKDPDFPDAGEELSLTHPVIEREDS